jgi:hypothetical protein
MRPVSLLNAALLATMFAGMLSAAEVGDNSIDFEFEKTWNTPAGASRLSDYKGKVVLLEWWATW